MVEVCANVSHLLYANDEITLSGFVVYRANNMHPLENSKLERLCSDCTTFPAGLVLNIFYICHSDFSVPHLFLSTSNIRRLLKV